LRTGKLEIKELCTEAFLTGKGGSGVSGAGRGGPPGAAPGRGRGGPPGGMGRGRGAPPPGMGRGRGALPGQAKAPAPQRAGLPSFKPPPAED
jgi:hypothetical protein